MPVPAPPGAGSGPRAPSCCFSLPWESGLRHFAAATRVFLPPLHEVLRALGSLIAKGQLQDHLAASLTRSAIGFGIAVVAAVALGLLVAWYWSLDRFLNPLLEVFRNTAALALLPVFTLLLGIGRRPRSASWPTPRSSPCC